MSECAADDEDEGWLTDAVSHDAECDWFVMTLWAESVSCDEESLKSSECSDEEVKADEDTWDDSEKMIREEN